MSIEYGNAIAVNAGFAPALGQPEFVISQVNALVGLVGFAATTDHIFDTDITPTVAAVTLEGAVIAAGKDNLNTSSLGGERLCVYNSNGARVYTEAVANIGGAGRAGFQYQVACITRGSGDNEAYFALTRFNSGITKSVSHKIVGINTVTGSVFFTSASSSGSVSTLLVASASDIYALGKDGAQPFITRYNQASPVWTLNLSAAVAAVDDSGIYLANSVTNSGVTSIQVEKHSDTNATLWTTTIPAPSAQNLTLAGMSAANPNVFVTGTDASGPTGLLFKLTQLPSLKSLTVSSPNLPGGFSSIGTATLNSVAAQATTINLQSSSTDLTVQATVTVPQGSTSQRFSFSTKGVNTQEPVTITGVDQSTGAERTATVILLPAVIQSLKLNSTTLTAGQSTTAVVFLTGQASASGANIAVSHTGDLLVPATVHVAPGKSGVSFTVGTAAVDADAASTLTVTLNGSNATANVLVKAPRFTSFSLLTSDVVGGSLVPAQVSLNGIRQSSVTVQFTFSKPGLVSGPASVNIAGSTRQSLFKFHTDGVDKAIALQISGSALGTTLVRSLTLRPASPVRLVFLPASVRGGTSVSAAVGLNGNAGPSGLTLTVGANNPPVIAPTTLQVLPGHSSVQFTIGTAPVDFTSAQTITCKSALATIQSTLTITPAELLKIVLIPNPVTGGQSVSAAVVLDAPAGPAGLHIALSSDNAAAKLPASITIQPGSKSQSFTITTTTVASQQTATIKAVLTRDNTNVTSTLTIN